MSKKDKFKNRSKSFHSSHGKVVTKLNFDKKNDKKKGKHHQAQPPSTCIAKPNSIFSALTTTSSVYKRTPSYPKAFPQLSTFKKFIKPTHPLYASLVTTSYEGFVYESGANCAADFDTRFQNALLQLDKLGYYQFDMTQPGGLNTKVAKTFVSRCLVGEAGGLLLFIHAHLFVSHF
ncbi:hypothetical protein EON65_55815 [archaeon]|nr:MAG: hypothetical protein EON65_55815 [archaeon]